jgi:hypothetical protein
VLDTRFDIEYTGIERKSDRVEAAQTRYAGRNNFKIVQDSAQNQTSNIRPGDIVVALETMEHIAEHIAVRIIEGIAAQKPGLFICSVPVEIGPAVWLKNIGSFITGYIRHKEYSWRETFWAGIGKLDKLPPHGTGHKGFDWRWLAQTIRHNMRIIEIRKLPVNFLPAMLSTTVFIIAEPRSSRELADRR